MQEENYEYAGFWIRFGALIVDSILILIVTLPLLFAIYGSQAMASEKTILGGWHILISYVLPAVGTILFWLKCSATPGKMALKLKVLDTETGNMITTSQACIRYLSYLPSILFLFLGMIWVGFDKKKQGWHDKIAGTVVVKVIGSDEVTFSK